jgi:leucyl aminopeptidase
MEDMKWDMGGAGAVAGALLVLAKRKAKANVVGVCGLVENMPDGNAQRPGDVVTTMSGQTVEVINTDAEGRLVLADALADADDEAPELLIDCATLTGAARMATGMELPPFFTDDEALAADLARHAAAEGDPMWRLPLWRGYEPTLSSSIADLTNNPSYNLAGAITAALFLNRFVEKAQSWLHLDIPGWVDRPKPGRRTGGEANGARALFALLSERYGR